MLETAITLLFLFVPFNLSVSGHFEESERILSSVSPSRGNYEMYSFCRLLNNFSLNKRDQSLKYSAMLTDSFTDTLPVRYRALAHLMREDLKTWDSGLGDIARDMRLSSRRLELAKNDQGTRDLQKQIVDKLDKMIKDEEGKGNPPPGDGEGDGKDAKSAKRAGSVPTAPQSDSVMGGVAGAGKVDERAIRQATEQWGSLPPEKRAKVVQDITRDLPLKYKVAIEGYFRSLSRTR